MALEGLPLQREGHSGEGPPGAVAANIRRATPPKAGSEGDASSFSASRHRGLPAQRRPFAGIAVYNSADLHRLLYLLSFSSLAEHLFANDFVCDLGQVFGERRIDLLELRP
jgi:hypothetical protein